MNNEAKFTAYFVSYTSNEWDENIITVAKGNHKLAWIVDGWHFTEVYGTTKLGYTNDENEVYFDLMSIAMHVERMKNYWSFFSMPLNRVVEDIISWEEMKKMEAIMAEDLPF